MKINILSLGEISEDELLAEKEKPEISDGSEDDKELDLKYEKADEEKEPEAEEKEHEEVETDLEEENKEYEVAEKDIDSSEDEVSKHEGGIIFPDVENKKEIPDEEFFHKEVIHSKAGVLNSNCFKTLEQCYISRYSWKIRQVIMELIKE